MRQFDPMRRLTERMNMPPEKVNVVTGAANQPGNPGFGACLLEMLGESKTAALIRTVIESEPIIGENYYRNVLMLYGAGFDRGLFRFDPNGRLVLQKKTGENAPAATPNGSSEAEKPEAAKEAQTTADSPAEAAAKPSSAPANAQPVQTESRQSGAAAEPKPEGATK